MVPSSRYAVVTENTEGMYSLYVCVCVCCVTGDLCFFCPAASPWCKRLMMAKRTARKLTEHSKYAIYLESLVLPKKSSRHSYSIVICCMRAL